jgi:hypothetical protein
MINTTLSSATKCTPFEIAHGLPARTIAQARIEVQHVGRGATDPEILEDVSPVFDGSAVKHLIPMISRLKPVRHRKGMKLRVGEMVIMLDYPESRDWYVAEVSQLLHDRFVVNGFITREANMVGYRQASKKLRLEALKKVAFLRTWCKDKGKGEATTVPPKHLKGDWRSTCGNGGFRSTSWISLCW